MDLLRAEFTRTEGELQQRQDDSQAYDAVLGVFGDYLDDSPEGWEFSRSSDRVELGEHEAVELDLTVVPGDSSGTAFAIVAVDAADGELFASSDVMVAAHGSEGGVRLLSSASPAPAAGRVPIEAALAKRLLAAPLSALRIRRSSDCRAPHMGGPRSRMEKSRGLGVSDSCWVPYRSRGRQ
jgi:hypothetical protein